MNRIKLRQLLETFFNEDIGSRDVTSEAMFAANDEAAGTYTAKASGVICGLPVLTEGYKLADPAITVRFHVQEGDRVAAGQDLVTVHGPVRALLGAERVLLNLLQHMSGIATMTGEAVKILKGSATRVCDTRKTTPGLRMLEKYAVTVGGGFNHRFGLDDAVMIKDNHITYAGSVDRAVRRARAVLGPAVKVEVETETLEMVREAVQAGADIIMFDNCTPEQIREWKRTVPATITTEASGGIDLATLPDYANCGVDYISLGCLTHSVRALDISFNIQMPSAMQEKGVHD